MNDQWQSVDPARSKLRALAARVDRELGQLDAAVAGGPLAAEASALADAWHELSQTLALGEEPELRTCPYCHHRVLRVATRCRYCMRASPAEAGGA